MGQSNETSKVGRGEKYCFAQCANSSSYTHRLPVFYLTLIGQHRMPPPCATHPAYTSLLPVSYVCKHVQ